jgi:phage tail sheath protein FI
MATYLSPGVYVEEVPSGSAPIAGVGTSTAGFIGVIADDTVNGPNPDVLTEVTGEIIPSGTNTQKDFNLANTPIAKAEPASFTVNGVAVPADEFTLSATQVTFETAPGTDAEIIGNYFYYEKHDIYTILAAGEVKLCTNFTEFKKYFGDFTTDPGQSLLAHAVYGFFNNGGTRCFVTRVAADGEVAGALEKFEAIDEIALVAVPGKCDPAIWAAVDTHCKNMGDRFAIFDSPKEVETDGDLDVTLLAPDNEDNVLPDFSDYAAFYFPWIQVFDPATKIAVPDGDGRIFVPPSGHIAGVYARVDTGRGVHKAPANEVIQGALGLKYQISKAKQDGLNPHGVNCIRDLNGNIRIWGARTIGGDANTEWKYLSVRRLFLFLRESIDEGTQWVVFEPNTPELWAKITRNVTAFLTNVWRSGALFGATPQEAFFVKCDAETNPPEVRDLGQVVTEIGVAVVKPAEFVIFRISQWAGPSG